MVAASGYDVPHYSIHRAELHRVPLEIVEARVGPVAMSHHCTRVVEEGARVLVHFEGAPPARADDEQARDVVADFAVANRALR